MASGSSPQRSEAKLRKRFQRRTRAWIIGAALVAGGLAAAAWLAVGRERLLTELARPVALLDMSGPRIIAARQREQGYWLSSTRLLIITTDHAGGTMVDLLPTWRGHADLFDIVTRQRRRLTGLTNRLNEVGRMPELSEVSPAGTWLHYFSISNGWEGQEAEHIIARVDGTEYRRWPARGYYPALWMDDAHFVDEGWEPANSRSAYSEDVVARDVRNSKADRRYPAESAQAKALLKRRDETQDVKVPEESIAYAVSPRHDALVYCLPTERIPPLQDRLHRLCRWISRRSHAYRSDLDQQARRDQIARSRARSRRERPAVGAAPMAAGWPADQLRLSRHALRHARRAAEVAASARGASAAASLAGREKRPTMCS